MVRLSGSKSTTTRRKRVGPSGQLEEGKLNSLQLSIIAKVKVPLFGNLIASAANSN
jgi:hypothetical protein